MIDPHVRFNGLMAAMREMRPAGESRAFRFFVQAEQQPNLRIAGRNMMALHYGLIRLEQVPQVGGDRNVRAILFSEGTFATANVELAAALTFQPEVVPSPSWYGPASAAVEKASAPKPEPVVVDEGPLPFDDPPLAGSEPVKPQAPKRPRGRSAQAEAKPKPRGGRPRRKAEVLH